MAETTNKANSAASAFELAMRKHYPAFPLKRQEAGFGAIQIIYISAGTHHMWNGWNLALSQPVEAKGADCPFCDGSGTLKYSDGSHLSDCGCKMDRADAAAARIAELERQNGELVEAARVLLDDMAKRAKARGDVDDDGTAILDAGASVVSNLDAAIASAAGKEGGQQPVAQEGEPASDVLNELRAQVVEMREAAYTYGYSEGSVRVALDGVLDEIDALRKHPTTTGGSNG